MSPCLLMDMSCQPPITRKMLPSKLDRSSGIWALDGLTAIPHPVFLRWEQGGECSHSWALVGNSPLDIKSINIQILPIKWCSICMHPMHILPYTLSHLWVTQNTYKYYVNGCHCILFTQYWQNLYAYSVESLFIFVLFCFVCIFNWKLVESMDVELTEIWQYFLSNKTRKWNLL